MARKPAFTLDRAQLTDLMFAAERIEDLSKIVASAASIAPTASFDDAAELVHQATGIPFEDVKKLIGVVLSFIATREAMKVSTRDVAEGVVRSLDKLPPSASSQQHDLWRSVESKLCEVVDAIPSGHPFHVLRKVSSVVYAHQNILTDIRVVTDLRPVFDESGQKILHSVISHKLIVLYNDGTRGRRIEFGVDATDLEEMRKLSERAQVKGKTIQEDLKQTPSWSVSLQTDS